MSAGKAAASAKAIYLSQCRYLLERYPALRELRVEPTLANAKELFGALCWQVRRIDPAAAMLDEVDFLEKTIREVGDLDLRGALMRKLLAIQARRGLAHKVLPLLAADDALRVTIDQFAAEHDTYYGVALSRYDLKGTSRGASLRLYFSHHPELVTGKRILHFGPEPELRAWMLEEAPRLASRYETADGFSGNVDHAVDLCDLPFADGAFDVVIIHRVLEHVIDGDRALRELHRVLSPEGLLNISVPEALYMPKTADWRVPDPNVHHHVRVYGRDFPLLLLNAGFRVDRCEWLIKQPPATLRDAHALPMPFHNAIKA